MSHTIIYNSELHIVESKLQGDMTVGEVEEIVTKIAKIAKEKDCRLIFTDFREVSRKLPMWQIYELPNRLNPRNLPWVLSLPACLCSHLNHYSRYFSRNQNVTKNYQHRLESIDKQLSVKY